MARLRDIVFDCDRPASLARFWAQVLEDYAVAPYDDAELARLRGLGIEDPEDDPTVLVEPSSHMKPRLWFQKVAEGKIVKNRVHLDPSAADVDEEVRRLVASGARELHSHATGVTLADPEGSEFGVAAP